jgi:hypothetical protein
MKTNIVIMVNVDEWDKLVQDTYKRPYSFQQQEGCKERGIFELTVPSKHTNDEGMNDTIPEEINGETMGVKFKVWLERDPKQPIPGQTYEWENTLFWTRNFYPDVLTVANDLHSKGLLNAGKYIIKIDW